MYTCSIYKQGLVNRTVWVTGFSQGGAVAVLAGRRMQRAGCAVRGVYTFGSPRVGTAAYTRNYEVPCYRFVNQLDWVPWLPLNLPALRQGQFAEVAALLMEQGRSGFHAYQHVGHLYFLNGQEQVTTSEDAFTRERMLALFRTGATVVDGIQAADRAHDMDEYLRILAKNTR